MKRATSRVSGCEANEPSCEVTHQKLEVHLALTVKKTAELNQALRLERHIDGQPT